MVVVADGRLHHVHDRGTAVDDDPLAVVFALGAHHREPSGLDGIAHARGKGLGLPVAGARGDDHALEQRRQVLGVEDDDVVALHVFQTIDDGALQFTDVHSAPGVPSVEVVSVNIARDGGRHHYGSNRHRRQLQCRDRRSVPVHGQCRRQH